MEIKTSGIFTSSTLAKLLKTYKWYALDMIREDLPIISIEKFYRLNVKEKTLSKSIAFENYLNKQPRKRDDF